MAEIDVTRIAGNIGAMNSLNALTNINKQLSIHQTRLSTGKRINSAADDPAGLTIATKMLSRSEGLKVALSNIGDAKNLLAVAESGLGRINDILVQMRNKAEQGASDTLGLSERAAIVTQLSAYAAQIDDIVDQTEWNGNKLIDGSFDSTALTFQTGAGGDDTTEVDGLKDLSASNGNGLKLAYIAEETTAVIASDGSITSDAAADAVATIADDETVFDTGSYTVRVTAATTETFTAELLDANGVVLDTQTGLAATATVDFDHGGVTGALSVELNIGSTETTIGAVTESVINIAKTGDLVISDNGTDTGNQLWNAGTFNSYMTHVNSKLSSVTAQLSRLGALTGRLTFKEDQVSAAQINVEASYNRIMNANMAEEQVNASKFQILQQTATAMLAQANAAPQFLLSLFR